MSGTTGAVSFFKPSESAKALAFSCIALILNGCASPKTVSLPCEQCGGSGAVWTAPSPFSGDMPWRVECDKCNGTRMMRVPLRSPEAYRYMSAAGVPLGRGGQPEGPGAMTAIIKAPKGDVWPLIAGEIEQDQAKQDAQVFLYKGLAFANAGDWDRAILEYDEAIKLDPSLAEAYNHRGGAYFSKGDYARAIAEYTKAVRLNPKFSAAYNNLGNAHSAMRDYKRAEADYTRAIETSPNYVSALNNRGVARYRLKKDIKALKDFDRAIKLDPGYVQAYINRGSLHYARNNRFAAIDDFTKAIELDPANAEAFRRRGTSYHERYQNFNIFGRWINGELDHIGYLKGNVDIQTALDIEDYPGMEHFNIGYDLCRWKKNYAAAIEELSLAIDQIHLDPCEWQAKGMVASGMTDRAMLVFSEYYYWRGLAHYRRKEYQSSIEDLTRAIALNPNEGAYYLVREKAYRKTKDNQRAHADWQKQIELYRDEEMTASCRD